MSTTIKRVALVAVAALGLGVLSVAPSTAVTNADALAVSATTAAQTTAETATATSATTTLTYLAGATTDTMSVTASLVSAPAGATALPYLQVVETASAQAGNGNLTVLAAGTGSVSPNTAGLVWPTAAPAAVSAKFKVYLGQGSATTAPTTVGTYVVKLTPAVVAGGGSLNATAQTITITVTAAPTLDTVAASATVVLNKGETNSATTDDVVTSTKSASTSDAAATLSVALKNAAGSAVSAESFTATVSGPGTLGSGATSAVTTITPLGRALTVRNGDLVELFPDGTAGVATVTISSAAGKVLASKTVTFYGAIASIVTTVAKPVIGVRTDASAVTAKAYDAAGVLVSSGNLYLTSADTTIISNSATSAAIDATTGVATWSLVGVKAGSTTVVVANAASSATVSAAAAAVRVGGTSAELANVKVTTDKSVYAPGEIATITVTPVDAAGLTLADDTYTVFATGGITPSYVLGSSSDTISGTQVVGTSAGVKTYKVYLPIAEGDVKFSWTTGTLAASTANSAVAGSLTVNVSSASTNAAIDAANEASAAASDATDAALAAADAADAATAAAQDAVDAVAALSTQVNKLISALKAQITTLTNLVIKIQKKVKA